MKTHIASMAVNPLEGLMSVNQRLVWSSTAEPQRQQSRVESSPASLHQPRQRTRSGHQPRPWECGSSPIPGPGSGILVQSRTPRSQNTPENAARERSRVRNLRQAFHSLQAALPSVPADTKLSKLDVLLLAADYIAHLTNTLQRGGVLVEPTLTSRPGGYLHPVKKWPMRSLLYCGSVGELLSGNPMPPIGQDGMKKQEADNGDSRII